MYRLDLTEEDVSAISFVGNRYNWSDALWSFDVGTHDIPEHEAWGLKEAFEADTEGGHGFFPMLSADSELYDKLVRFIDSIV